MLESDNIENVEAPTERKKGRRWTREEIILSIKNLKEGERSFRVAKEKNSAAVAAAIKSFGNWEAALISADVPAEREVRKPWTVSEIIEEIKIMPEGFRSFSDASVKLGMAALRYFGSWKTAVEAAGLPAETRQRTGAIEGNTFENIVRDLLELIQPQWKYKKLRKNKCIPDWTHVSEDIWLDAKIRSHGIEVDRAIKKYIKNTSKLIILYAKGRRENIIQVEGAVEFWHISVLENLCTCDESRRLYNKAAALEKRQYTWSDSEHYVHWTQDRVVSELSKLECSEINALTLHKNNSKLYDAARKCFGNYSAALKASGFDPETAIVKRTTNKRWSKEIVIYEIQKFNGAPYMEIYKKDSKLCTAACRYFGNWESALKESQARSTPSS